MSVVTSATVAGLRRGKRRPCLICGEPNHACVGTAGSPVRPVDQIDPTSDRPTGEMEIVDIVVNGFATQVKVRKRPPDKKVDPPAPAKPERPGRERPRPTVRTK